MIDDLLARPIDAERRLAMTYEEYLALPTDSIHAEWVRGEAIIFMPPKIAHQDAFVFLVTIVRMIVDELELGLVLGMPCEMHLPDQQVSREPDIMFVANANLDRLDEHRLTGPADLVVEIISEGTERYDRRDKFREYAAADVPEYWMIDVRPGKRPVEPYVLVDGGYQPIPPDERGRYRSVVIPVYWLDPAWLRQSPLPRTRVALRQILPEAF